MSFVEQLREELVDAAEREQERTGPRVHLPPLRPVALAAAGVALAAILVIVVAGGLRTSRPASDDHPARPPSTGMQDLFGGTLEPGVRYRTRALVPPLSFVVGDRNWYVPDASSLDQLPLVRVTRGRPASGPPNRTLGFVRIREVFEPGVRGLQASRAPAPNSLYAWLRRHPDLRVGPAARVTIAGVAGESFTAEVHFRRPAHSDPLCREHLRTCTLIAPGSAFENRAHLRIIQLDTTPGPLYIGMSAPTAHGLAAVEGAARPLLDSLRVEIR